MLRQRASSDARFDADQDASTPSHPEQLAPSHICSCEALHKGDEIEVETTDTKNPLSDIRLKLPLRRTTELHNDAKERTAGDSVMAASPELRPSQRRKTALPATMLVIGFVALGGCMYQNNTSAEPALRQYWPHPEQVSFKHSTPDFHMVHCQLPPTIHRLGLELAYLGPTRKVRTSIRDCVIRGGNFVVFDGADRAT